jgi:glycosyltransferase involved in cell wall biosynthesis
LQAESILHRYFDHIYLVNLPREISRKLTAAKHLRQHGIEFEYFEATDGYEGEVFEHYRRYSERKLGDLERYSHYAEREIKRGAPFIDSPGAMGYIYTYLRILCDAKEKGYERFLIFEDDVILHRDFETMFDTFMRHIDPDWRIIQLGATQTGWRNIDLAAAEKNRFYFPTYYNDRNSTYGSFAMGLDHRIIDELIEAESAFEAAFDYLPMEEMYEKYKGKCFIAYPNLVIPDVRTSTIRNEMDQEVVAKKLKWDLSRFDYPLEKPSLTVILNEKKHFHQALSLDETLHEHITLSFVYPTSDGLRPFHVSSVPDIVDDLSNHGEKPHFPVTSAADYVVSVPKGETLSDEEIMRFIEYELSLGPAYKGVLEKIDFSDPDIEAGLLSLIVPVTNEIKYETLARDIASYIARDTRQTEVVFIGNDTNDAASVDNATAALKRIHPQVRIRSYIHSTPRNHSAFRNTGLTYAKGEFICFIEPRHRYDPSWFAHATRVLSNTNKQIGASYGSFARSVSFSLAPRYKDTTVTFASYLLDYEHFNLCFANAVFKRRSLLVLNGFDESSIIHDDTAFYERYLKHYTLHTSAHHAVVGTSAMQFKRYCTSNIKRLHHLKSEYFNDEWIRMRLENEKDCKQKTIALNRQNERLSILSELIDKLGSVSFFKHPVKKIRLYKQLIHTFYRNIK